MIVPISVSLLLHAGICPQWNLATAKQCAAEVEQVLQQGDYLQLLREMYQNSPDLWSEDLSGIERLRYSINAFTRMLLLSRQSLRICVNYRQMKRRAPLKPWFELDNPLYQQTAILFGHWASLVDYPTPKIFMR